MSDNRYLNSLSLFQKSLSLCDFFQLLSIDTWERIKFARTRKGLKIYETTITQNLLFELNRTKEFVNSKKGPNFWNFNIYEAVNERANGNDVELYLPFNGGYLLFPIQAKLINHKGYKRKKMNDGDYKSMDHLVSSIGQQQIDSLIKYASNKRGLPLYLLYNYVNDIFKSKPICDVDVTIEQYGCSIISADHIYNNYYSGGIWTIPKFSDLHPTPAMPWFVLVCCFLSKEKLNEYFPSEQLKISKLKTYSKQEITAEGEWKIFETKTISYQEYVNNPDQLGFIPKFRIVLESSDQIKE